MNNHIQYRMLTRDDLGQVYQTFVEAFSQYNVNMKMPKDVFRHRMLYKLDIQFNVSPGAFAGDKLVGFIFHTIQTYQGKLTAYNGGTGVIPSYWNMGITRQLYQYCLPTLQNLGVQQGVLEVLTDNQAAIKAYENCGFEVNKIYHCFKLKTVKSTKQLNEYITIATASNPDFGSFTNIATIQTSIIDQLPQLSRSPKKETTLIALSEGKTIGFLIFQSNLGRISQLAVLPSHRELGVGTSLVTEALGLSKSPTLTLLNLDASETATKNALERIGFINELDQFEMKMNIE